MIELEYVERCPLCGSLQKKTIYEEVNDSLFNAEGEWTFVACSSCGLIFLDPRPKPEETHKTYTKFYSKRKLPTQPYDNSWKTRLKRLICNSYFRHFHGYVCVQGNIFLSYIPVFVPYLRKKIENQIFRIDFVKDGRLLDVGCGVGDFLHNMMSLGWNAEGIDNDVKVVEKCKNRNLKVRVGFLEEQKYPENYFDVIVLKHVLEHVNKPVELLIECKRILKPYGNILILTPNCESTAHKKFGRYWLGLDVSRHLYIFSPLTLLSLIEKSGLKVSAQRSTTRISKFVWLASYYNRNFGKSVYREESSTAARFKANLFVIGLWFELFFNSSAGDEIEMVAKKR